MDAGWAILGVLFVGVCTMGSIAMSLFNISNNLYGIKLQLERLNSKR